MPSIRHEGWRELNRRVHTYLGLYLLVFLWLLAFSGLCLNHAWSFTEFWNRRQQIQWERTIQPLAASDPTGKIREVMQQLGETGHAEPLASDNGGLKFRMVRPGRIVEISVDTRGSKAVVHETRVNTWGWLRMLHTFSGSKASPPASSPGWIWATLWRFAMDALAVGILLLVAGSLVLAFERRERRRRAALALAAGSLVMLFFLYGWHWV